MPMFRSRSPAIVRSGPTVSIADHSIGEFLGLGEGTDSGVVVTPQKAPQFAAVWRAMSLLYNLTGALPLHTYKANTRDKVSNNFVDDPHPDYTTHEFFGLTAAHRAGWGNFYGQKVRNGLGEVRYCYPIMPHRVRPWREAPSAENPSGKWFDVTTDDGTIETMSPREILHVPGWGYDGVKGLSPISMARAAIGLGLAQEAYAGRLFGNGTLLSGVLQTDRPLKQPMAEAAKRRWREKFGSGVANSHDVVILDSGLKFQPLTMPNDDAQFLESRDFSTSEIGRFYGIPPFLMGQTEKSTSWGTGLEQQLLGFVNIDLHPAWLSPLEKRITKEMVRPRQYAKFALGGMLRGDSKARADFYRAMRELGIMSGNEVRELEDLPPVASGDDYMVPANTRPAGVLETEGSTEE